MKKLTLIAFVFPFIVGCELVDVDSFARTAGKYTVETPTGTKYMSLDEALARANSSYDLELLTDQFWEIGFLGPSDEDRRKVERRRKELRREELIRIRRQQEQRLEYLRRSHEQRVAEEEQIRREQRVIFEAWKADRAKFIENAPGSLKNMGALEVRKMVDAWKREGTDLFIVSEADFDKICSVEYSVENFYKVFGKPDRISLIEDSYYLHYRCKDGLVQIEVSASYFDKGIVGVIGLNIF